MTNDNHRQNIDANIVGNNHAVNNRHAPHHHGGPTKGSSSGEDVAGAGLGILVSVFVICWIFVRHPPEVYFYLKLGALMSAIPFLGMVAFEFSEDAPNNREITATFLGFALSVASFFLAQYGHNRLDHQLLEFGQQAQDAQTFWNGLTEYGHNLVMGNLIGAVCLGATEFFSLLMGLFVLWNFVSSTDIEYSPVLRILRPFRPRRGGILASLAIIVAWAFESGFVFEVLKPAAEQ